MISIVVPVYNVEAYLSKCVKSLLCQTYRDIEIILVDDGSTDSSGEICDYLQNENPSLVRAIHTANSGLSAARNVGIDHAHGEYIGFVDSDDWVEPEMFEVLITNMKRYDTQLSICALRADFDDKELELRKYNNEQILDYRALMDALLRTQSVLGYACNKLFVTELARVAKFDETLYSSEDIDFCVRYAQCLKKAVATPSELYHYRQRLGSMAGEFSFSFRKLSVLKAYENILPVYKNRTPELAYIVERYLLKQHLNVVGRLTISKIENKQLLNELWSRIDTLWDSVMQEDRNTIIEKINIRLTRLMPSLMLRIKQWVIMRHYK